MRYAFCINLIAMPANKYINNYEALFQVVDNMIEAIEKTGKGNQSAIPKKLFTRVMR